MKRIHIGPIPPPLGGISVYLYRLSKIERSSYFIQFKRHKLWVIRQIFNRDKKNFIYHNQTLIVRLFLYFFTLISIHKFSLVIHSRSLQIQYNNSNILIKFLMRKMLNQAYFIQVVNPDYKKFLREIRVKNNNIFVKNAFLPPPLEDEKKIKKTYDRKLIKFINCRKPIIVANAYAINFYKNKDLYGIDMCVDLTSLLKKDFPNIGFIFALANEKRYPDYFKFIKDKIKMLRIEDNFHFMTGQKELWPIFKLSDLMIRPTCIDAFGISIAEALYFQCPAIASDVCKRENGTIIFHNRDLKDLYEKCISLLKKN